MLLLSLSNCSAAAAKSRQLCPTLCDPIDGSPPGSAVLGILHFLLQVRYLDSLKYLGINHFKNNTSKPAFKKRGESSRVLKGRWVWNTQKTDIRGTTATQKTYTEGPHGVLPPTAAHLLSSSLNLFSP